MEKNGKFFLLKNGALTMAVANHPQLQVFLKKAVYHVIERDDGQSIALYFIIPNHFSLMKDELPAVICIHDELRIDLEFMELAEKLSNMGEFIVVIPDFQLNSVSNIESSSWCNMIIDIAAISSFMKTHCRCFRVGVLGFSAGAALVLSAVSNYDIGVSAVVSYYGCCTDSNISNIRVPIQFHFGRKDETTLGCTRAVDCLETKCKEGNVPYQIVIWEAASLFMKKEIETADRSLLISIDFFQKNLRPHHY